jgi:alpha-beta hydrolase superfamily lysophospholipase
MGSADFSFETSDGARLHVNGWESDSPKAVVQVVHGMAEFGARYERLAEKLGQAGYHTFAHDHRGHGRSIQGGLPPGHIADADSWNLLVSDTHAINRELARRYPGLPVIVLGHSMGSFIVQQLMFQHPGDMVAACLSASNGRPGPTALAARLMARIERARLGRRGASPVLRKLTFDDFNKQFAPTRTNSDWLSRDPKEVDIYVADPLLGFTASNQTWVDLLDALSTLADRRNIARVPKDLPIYIFSGDRDPVGENGKGVRRLYDAYKRAGIYDVRLKLYPGARHETLNEINRKEVMADFVRWCEEVTAQLS